MRGGRSQYRTDTNSHEARDASLRAIAITELSSNDAVKLKGEEK
jgi:hypothetical protein